MEKPHKKLNAWKLSINVASEVYRITAQFPSEEKFGLAAQMRRAAVSVVSNLAEGAARGSRKDFRRFLLISRSSLSELDTQLDLCVRLGVLSEASRSTIDESMVQIDKMLFGLYKTERK